jgi:Rrf2 family protein
MIPTFAYLLDPQMSHAAPAAQRRFSYHRRHRHRAQRAGPAAVAAKALATRHRLPPRHLEPVLQALVRHGILRGIRGPHGGYELAREQHRITADDILRAAGTVDEIDGAALAESLLLSKVVMPALGAAENAFSAALARINVEDLAHSAQGLGRVPGEA